MFKECGVGLIFCLGLGQTYTLARSCYQWSNVDVVHLDHYQGITCGDIAMNVCQPRDLCGDIRLEFRIVQVYFACLVCGGVPRDTPEQHLLRNGAELFNQSLELCLKLGF